MRHIKIYEEYTDEEIRNLQDTLHDIGQSPRWTYGEDFGFGLSPKFQTQITGDDFPSISGEFFKHLFSKGEIVPKGMAFGFNNPEEFGIDEDFDSGITPSVFPNRYAIHIRPKNQRVFTNAEMAYVFAKVIQSLGEVRK